ncbi:ATP-binding protein [Streptomyces griseofuscus]|uniref:ATP-binding protein n=2 Tax=Streptomyces TaxID=1883 RepID=A0A7H1Q096_9ACTN|nr:ATP-binding protein [Streptomyces griseofuscus]BBC94386.1 ATP-binding protein [Streptomyces rochei]
MVSPLGIQAMDEPRSAPSRYSAVWGMAGISIADARGAVRTLLARAGHHPDQQSNQDAQLVVSELVTNALRYAPGPGALLLELSADAARLTIAVRDGSSDQPLLREPDPRRAGGHGLHLVTRLCEQVRTVPSGEGKRIVAELLLDSGAEPGG